MRWNKLKEITADLLAGSVTAGMFNCDEMSFYPQYIYTTMGAMKYIDSEMTKTRHFNEELRKCSSAANLFNLFRAVHGNILV